MISAIEQITVAPENGQQGNPGPLFYPAGEWKAQSTYTRTSDACPFVLYEKKYYYLTKEGGYHYFDPDDESDPEKARDRKNYGNPLESASLGGVWKVMSDIGFIFTEFLMANFALLAGAVAYNNQMFSQQGTVENVHTPDNYTDPNFKPYLSLDWGSGELVCQKANIRGHVEATSGSFTGDINAASGTFSGYLKIPFKTFEEGARHDKYQSYMEYYTVTDSFNLMAGGGNEGRSFYNLTLPSDPKYVGTVLNVYDPVIKTRMSPSVQIKGIILHPNSYDSLSWTPVSTLYMGVGGLIQLIAVDYAWGEQCAWLVLVDNIPGGSLNPK